MHKLNSLKLLKKNTRLLSKGSLSRYLIIRLMPALLVLFLLDFSVTWFITHEFSVVYWDLQDILLLILAGQVILVILFAWLVVYGIRSGLRSVNLISTQIAQRNEEDLQAIDMTNVPTELAPLVSRINELFRRLDESMAAQRRFIGHAAHQLRTPLAGLRLESELMLAQPLPEDVRKRAERIKSISNRMIHLGQQLLVLARADPGIRPQNSFSRIDLCEWVQTSGSEWVPKTRQQHIDLLLEAPACAVWIDGDPLLLEELLGNLIDNALKYAKGAKHIVLTVGQNPPSLSVEDDGCGIEPEDRQHVFEAFYRASGVGVSGSGLGLQVVQEIARAHGAGWSLVSKPVIKGTRITVVFPGPRIGTQLSRQEKKNAKKQ